MFNVACCSQWGILTWRDQNDLKTEKELPQWRRSRPESSATDVTKYSGQWRVSDITSSTTRDSTRISVGCVDGDSCKHRTTSITWEATRDVVTHASSVGKCWKARSHWNTICRNTQDNIYIRVSFVREVTTKRGSYWNTWNNIGEQNLKFSNVDNSEYS